MQCCIEDLILHRYSVLSGATLMNILKRLGLICSGLKKNTVIFYIIGIILINYEISLQFMCDVHLNNFILHFHIQI